MRASPDEGKRLMGRALTSQRIAFRGLRWRNVRAYASWLGSADICSLLPPSFPGRRASACGGAFRQRVSIQEFADLYPNSSSRSPCPCIPVEPTSTLASEGVELEFRCPTPSESCRLVLSTQQKFLASSVSGASQGRGKDFCIKHKKQSGNHLL